MSACAAGAWARRESALGSFDVGDCLDVLGGLKGSSTVDQVPRHYTQEELPRAINKSH